MKYITTVDGVEFEVEILDGDKINVNGTVYDIDFEEVSGQMIFSLIVDGRSYEINVSEEDNQWNILIHGRLYTAEVIDEREKRLLEASGELAMGSSEFVLEAPMPGLVVKVPVKVGKKVERGDVLVILESMKMQNELRAPRDGTVTQINVNEGDNVEKRDAMVVLGTEED